jgi:hypothetical protein
MRKLWLLLLVLPPFLMASWLDYRLHVWAQVSAQNGPVISLSVRGQLKKLTPTEREFLNQVAHDMLALERAPKNK